MQLFIALVMTAACLVGLATVATAAASWSISIQMPSGLLTKVSINVLFICVGQLEIGFSFLPGEQEYIEPEGIIWPL